jgi:hypothetical protein
MYVAQFFRVINPDDNPPEYALAQSSPYYGARCTSPSRTTAIAS